MGMAYDTIRGWNFEGYTSEIVIEVTVTKTETRSRVHGVPLIIDEIPIWGISHQTSTLSSILLIVLLVSDATKDGTRDRDSLSCI